MTGQRRWTRALLGAAVAVVLMVCGCSIAFSPFGERPKELTPEKITELENELRTRPSLEEAEQQLTDLIQRMGMPPAPWSRQ